MKRYVQAMIAASILGLTLTSSAAGDAPMLSVQMDASRMAGALRDGEQLGRGVVSCGCDNKGFRVSSRAARLDGRVGHYVLNGQYQPEHRLRVRLEQEGWHADAADGVLVSPGGEPRAAFNVVADGDQQIAADIYRMDFEAAVLR